MQLEIPFSPLLLSVTLLGVYSFCVWWLLKRERWSTLIALLLLTVGAALLHTYRIADLPPGLNDDEIKTLKSSHEFFNNRKIFVLAAQGPILHAILFQMPVAWWTDSTVWAMRTYPIIFGILAVPVSFSVGRSLRFGVIPSMVVASLVATLPWALFWGRISWGGEIVFYQALLLAALGRIIWCNGGRTELFIGAIGLSGLLWDYTGAWSMLAMPFIAALIGHSIRQRALCLGVFFLAVVLWIPYLLNIQEWWQHISNKVSVAPGKPSNSLLETLQYKVDHILMTLRQTLRVFYYPEGNVYWISMHSVAVHPTITLACAAIGAIVSLVRRSLFLTLGFLAGLTPALLSFSGAPSTHRMMCSFIFVSLACGATFQFLEQLLSKKTMGSKVTTAIAIPFTLVVTYQSVTLFFSEQFWSESKRIFFNSETALAETVRLPISPPLAAGPHINRILEARDVHSSGATNLTHERLAPAQPMTLAISPALSMLVPFYRENLPLHLVTSFGSTPNGTSIKAEFPQSEVERWSKYGWTVERICSDRVIKGVRLPVFYLTNELGWADPCPGQREIIMKAQWVREPTELSLVAYRGTSVKVETSLGTTVTASPKDQSTKQFTLYPEEVVTISVMTENSPLTWLREGREDTALLPALESFKPVP